MSDFEVHLSLDGETRMISHARSNRVRGKETVHFEYADEWLQNADHFALEPALRLAPLRYGGSSRPRTLRACARDQPTATLAQHQRPSQANLNHRGFGSAKPATSALRRFL
jgi:hypothetical protein